MIGERNGNKEKENHSIQSPRNSNHLLIPSPIICINQQDEGSLWIKFHAWIMVLKSEMFDEVIFSKFIDPTTIYEKIHNSDHIK